MSQSLNKKIGAAAIIMMASIFLSRIIGFGREMIIAHTAGANGAVDAYQVAFIIPDILNHIVAGGFLSVAFIPIFSTFLATDRENEGWRVFSIILNVFGLFLIVLIIIGIIFTPQLISLMAPGMEEPGLRESAIRMTRIIMPAQFFFFAGGLFTAVQFAKERFFIPALAPLVYNLGIITGGLCLGPWLGMEGFSWGVLAGAFFGNCFLQYQGAKKVGMKYYMIFDILHPQLKKYIFLTLPLIVGLTMTFSTEFFFKFFGSYLPRGSIAGLNYGLRTMLMVVGFFGQALGVASFPFMSRLMAQGKMEEMNKLLNKTLRYLALIIPFSILVMILNKEIVLLLFQHGKFDANATDITSQALFFLMIGAFAFGAQTIVVRGFYASQNTLFPSIYGSISVILSLPFYLIGINTGGVGGLGLAISFSVIFQVTLLYALWNKKSKNKKSGKVYLYYLKIMSLSIPLGFLLKWFKINALYGIDASTFMGSLLISIILGVLFAVCFIAMAYIFNIKEIFELITRVAGILRFKKN